MSCSVTERVADNRAAVGGPPDGTSPPGASVSVTTSGCRLRGTSSSTVSQEASTINRGTLSVASAPQNGPQSGPQYAPLRSKSCCLLWCCCCKCPW